MIFAVTGHAEGSYIEKSLNCGMNLVLFKPVDGKLLKELLGKLGFITENQNEIHLEF